MRKKNPLSVNSQVEHITNVTTSLKSIIPLLKYRRADYVGNSSFSKFRWHTALIDDINRQNLVKLIISSLRDILYKLLHKKPAIRTQDDLYEPIELSSILLLLNGNMKGLRKSVDSKEICDIFDKCFTELENVKYFLDNRQNTILTPAPANNIELDELY